MSSGLEAKQRRSRASPIGTYGLAYRARTIEANGSLMQESTNSTF